jgi:hypothetical protein
MEDAYRSSTADAAPGEAAHTAPLLRGLLDAGLLSGLPSSVGKRSAEVATRHDSDHHGPGRGVVHDGNRPDAVIDHQRHRLDRRFRGIGSDDGATHDRAHRRDPRLLDRRNELGVRKIETEEVRVTRPSNTSEWFTTGKPLKSCSVMIFRSEAMPVSGVTVRSASTSALPRSYSESRASHCPSLPARIRRHGSPVSAIPVRRAKASAVSHKTTPADQAERGTEVPGDALTTHVDGESRGAWRARRRSQARAVARPCPVAILRSRRSRTGVRTAVFCPVGPPSVARTDRTAGRSARPG